MMLTPRTYRTPDADQKDRSSGNENAFTQTTRVEILFGNIKL